MAGEYSRGLSSMDLYVILVLSIGILIAGIYFLIQEDDGTSGLGYMAVTLGAFGLVYSLINILLFGTEEKKVERDQLIKLRGDLASKRLAPKTDTQQEPPRQQDRQQQQNQQKKGRRR